MSIERLKEEYAIDILWRGFPLHPEIPQQGIAAEALFAKTPVDIKGMRGKIKEVAEHVGLPLGQGGMVYNSRLAQELAFWAESENKKDMLHEAIFEAYFVSGENIGEIKVLVELARSVGLSAADAEEVLTTRAYKPAVDLDWAIARGYNIHVVPTFAMNNHGLTGMQPYESLERFVVAHGATRR